jgi:hypothetical protein
MWGLKIDLTNDCSTSPLEEQVFGVIPLVPLFTVSFQQAVVDGMPMFIITIKHQFKCLQMI